MIKNNSVFLVTTGEDIDEVATEAYLYQSRKAANKQLHELTYGNLDEDSTCIYHGVLTEALYIPDNFKNCIPYLMIRNPERYTIELTSDEVWFKKLPIEPKAVIKYIQEILIENSLFKNKFSINDIFLFFGKKLTPVFHIPEDAIDDEELVDRLNTLENIITTNIKFFSKKENNGYKSKTTNN